jgi:hypothetical protein
MPQHSINKQLDAARCHKEGRKVPLLCSVLL